MSKNILVTGGAGYIGSILVPQLLRNGFNVTVLDNFMYKVNSLSSSCLDSNLNIIRGDIRDEKLLKKILHKFEYIIPLAAYVGAPLCDSDPFTSKQVNQDATLKILDLISKDQKIIMPTTNSAYGRGDEHNYCNEESPLNPISSYAIQKVEVEKKLMETENSVSFRLATVFGMSPKMRLDLLVNDFTYRACNDGFIVLYEGHFKNYIHVTDVAKSFIFCINNFSKMKNNIFNVGLSEANISKFELCKLIQSLFQNFILKRLSYLRIKIKEIILFLMKKLKI